VPGFGAFLLLRLLQGCRRLWHQRVAAGPRDVFSRAPGQRMSVVAISYALALGYRALSRGVDRQRGPPGRVDFGSPHRLGLHSRSPYLAGSWRNPAARDLRATTLRRAWLWCGD